MINEADVTLIHFSCRIPIIRGADRPLAAATAAMLVESRT